VSCRGSSNRAGTASARASQATSTDERSCYASGAPAGRLKRYRRLHTSTPSCRAACRAHAWRATICFAIVTWSLRGRAIESSAPGARGRIPPVAKGAAKGRAREWLVREFAWSGLRCKPPVRFPVKHTVEEQTGRLSDSLWDCCPFCGRNVPALLNLRTSKYPGIDERGNASRNGVMGNPPPLCAPDSSYAALTK
jgi:hypothetical protein